MTPHFITLKDTSGSNIYINVSDISSIEDNPNVNWAKISLRNGESYYFLLSDIKESYRKYISKDTEFNPAAMILALIRRQT